MQRRRFIALLGSATGWPFTARADQKAVPVVGYLHTGSSGPLANETLAFLRGLAEAGYIVGQNVAIEYRWAEGRKDQLAVLAADLVGRHVDVIAAIGLETALAVKAATSTIPVYFQIGGDPVKAGLVASLNHPGGNMTGLSLFVGMLEPKRLQMLHELVPKARQVAVLINPLVPDAEDLLKAVQYQAAAMGLTLLPMRVSEKRELDTAFATFAEHKADALLVFGSPLFDSERDDIVNLAARYLIPGAYPWREFVVAGAPMSYGTSLSDASRQGGLYVGRILRGEKPADLPVQQPTKFELVINMNAAKTLGLTVPQSLTARADEIIE